MKITARSLRRNKYFIEFINYVNNYWRPNTEAYIRIEERPNKKNILIKLLKLWFDKYPHITITIGPYKDIYPYSYYYIVPDIDKPILAKNINYTPTIEFLFLYDDIIKSKLKTVHFTLGRSDFVDLA